MQKKPEKSRKKSPKMPEKAEKAEKKVRENAALPAFEFGAADHSSTLFSSLFLPNARCCCAREQARLACDVDRLARFVSKCFVD
jgi:hypothetical protein